MYTSDILSDLPNYTKSGNDPVNPRNSRAVARIPIPETTTVPNMPHTYGSADVPVHKLVEQQAAQQSEIAILRAAAALNAPLPANSPNMPRVIPGTPTVTGAATRAMNPLLTFLQLLGYSGDLNTGEDEELAKKQPKIGSSGDPRAAANLQPDVRNALGLLP